MYELYSEAQSRFPVVSVTVVLSKGPKEVPDVRGKSEAQARQILTDAGFKVSVVYDSTTKKKKGTVIDQNPSAGTPEPQGYIVQLVVSQYEPSQSSSPTNTPTATDTPTDTPSP